jgi:hypothetical protein
VNTRRVVGSVVASGGRALGRLNVFKSGGHYDTAEALRMEQSSEPQRLVDELGGCVEPPVLDQH